MSEAASQPKHQNSSGNPARFVKISPYLLSFDSAQTCSSYEQNASDFRHATRLRSSLLYLTLKLAICFISLLASGSTNDMKLVTVFSLVCLVFLTFASMCTQSYALNISTDMASFAAIVVMYILNNNNETTNSTTTCTSEPPFKKEGQFVAAFITLLFISDISYSPFHRGFLLILCSIVYAAFFSFSAYTCVLLGMIVFYILLNLHESERASRVSFLELTSKKNSLKQWEQMLDMFVTDPVLVISKAQQPIMNSFSDDRQRIKDKILRQQRKGVFAGTGSAGSIGSGSLQVKSNPNPFSSATEPAAVTAPLTTNKPANNGHTSSLVSAISSNGHTKNKASAEALQGGESVVFSGPGTSVVAVQPASAIGTQGGTSTRRLQYDEISEQRADNLFISDIENSEHKIISGSMQKMTDRTNLHNGIETLRQQSSVASPKSSRRNHQYPTEKDSIKPSSPKNGNSAAATAAVAGVQPGSPSVKLEKFDWQLPQLEFSNASCARHFAEQFNSSSSVINASSAIVSQLKHIYIHNYMFNSAGVVSQRLGFSEAGVFSKSNETVTGKPELVTLSDYLAEKLNSLTANKIIYKPKKSSSPVNPTKQNKNNSSTLPVAAAAASSNQLKEETYPDDFEINEIEVLNHCERTVSNGLGVMVQTYIAHIYKVFFRGKHALMVCLKETTHERKAFNFRIIENQNERLLKSLLGEAVMPLSKVVQSIDHNKENRQVAIVKQQCLQTSSAIEDIMDYWSVMSGNLQLRKSWVAIGTVMDEIIEMYEEEMRLRELQYTLVWDMYQYDKIFTDVARFKRVVSNMLQLSLTHTLNSPIIIKLGYYDTREETILITLSHLDSFLAEEMIALLMHPPENLAIDEYSNLPIGKSLQILLSAGLIERLGPPNSLTVRRDEKFVEISFLIYTNLHGQGVAPPDSFLEKASDVMPQFISFNRENNNNQAFMFDIQSRSHNYSISHIKRPSRKSSVALAGEQIVLSPQRQTETLSMQGISPGFNPNQQLQQAQTNTNQHLLMQSPSVISIQTHFQTQQQQQQQQLDVQSNARGPSVTRLESACLLTEEIIEKWEEKRVSESAVRGVFRKTKQDSVSSAAGVSANALTGVATATATQQDSHHQTYSTHHNLHHNSTNHIMPGIPSIMALKFGGGASGTTTTAHGTHLNLADKHEQETLHELESMLINQKILVIDSESSANVAYVLSKIKSLEVHTASDLTTALGKIVKQHEASSVLTLSAQPFYKMILVNIEQQLNAKQNPISATNVKKVALYLKNVLMRNTPILLLQQQAQQLTLQQQTQSQLHISTGQQQQYSQETKELIVQEQMLFLELPLTIEKLAKILKRSISMASTQANSLPSFMFH